jgi:hypothetical protein
MRLPLQLVLEKAKTEKDAQGEFESEHPGYCGAQAHQQTFIEPTPR